MKAHIFTLYSTVPSNGDIFAVDRYLNILMCGRDQDQRIHELEHPSEQTIANAAACRRVIYTALSSETAPPEGDMYTISPGYTLVYYGKLDVLLVPKYPDQSRKQLPQLSLDHLVALINVYRGMSITEHDATELARCEPLLVTVDSSEGQMVPTLTEAGKSLISRILVAFRS